MLYEIDVMSIRPDRGPDFELAFSLFFARIRAEPFQN